MDLDKLGIALRPRNHWEAVDLGFALARQWFAPLAALWLMTATPVALLLVYFFDDNMLLMSLLIWWFKPLYEPPLMFWLSRAVFGERPPLKQVGKKWWSIVRPQLFANLTWRRFSGNRSFYMPVALLEGLKSKARSQRVTILGRRQHAGTWLTVVGIHFELVLELGFLLTIYFLVPEELRWFRGDSFLLSPGSIDEWLQLACWFTAMAMIAPFYVASGFALYLHRRSELEGWDIEINFRRMAEKVSANLRSTTGVAVAALFALFFAISSPQPAHASASASVDPGPKASKQSIEQVLADPLFGQMEKKSYWKYVGKTEKDESKDLGWLAKFLKLLAKIFEGFMQGFAGLGEIILWGIGLLIVVYLIYQFSRNAAWMQTLTTGKKGKERVLPSRLFGLDVRPESLPDDIVAEALLKIKAGKLRQALSLLYRGTLVQLISEHQLDIPDSATEGECLKLVQHSRGQNEAHYFERLTHTWLVTAYAHIPPDAHVIEQLCTDWRKVYGHAEN